MEPAVGASTWASGSQVWTGHMGTLTANEANSASHSQRWVSMGKSNAMSEGMLVVPAAMYMAMMASRNSTEPNRVKRKNLKVA